MKTKKIKIVIVWIIAILAIVGGYFYPKFGKNNSVGAISSSSGTMFSNSSIAAESLVTGTSTIFSVLNTGDSDRIIESFSAHIYTGTVSTTSTSFSIQCATSTSASSLGGNTNYVLNQLNTQFGTTTADGLYIVSSSTPGIIGAPGPLGTTTRIWNGGGATYLVCELTSADGAAQTSLNTALKGYLRFPYQQQ